jgi:peptidoglycan/LPS O-acetylase OafA/YrhL
MTETAELTSVTADLTVSFDRVVIQQDAKVRLAGIECLRVAAMLQILCFHALRHPLDLGGSAVLMTLAVALAADTHPGLSWKVVLEKRVQRLFLPFIFWSGFYAVVRIVRAFLSGKPLAEFFDPWMLIAGTEDHLWFLPACFVFTGIVGALAANGQLLHGLKSCTAWAVSAGVAVWFCDWAIQFIPRDDVMPLFGWVKVLPSVLVALSLAALPKIPRDRFLGLTLLVTLVLLASVSTWLWGLGLLASPQGMGVFACALAWAVKGRAAALLTRLGVLTYGVYLIHFFVLVVLNKLLHVRRGFVLLLLVTISSFLLAEVLRHTPVRRFV